MTLAAAALDMQTRLLRWTISPSGKRLTYSMAETDPSADKIDVKDLARVFFDGQTIPLDLGETFAVTTEIMDLVDAASQSLPDFTLRPYDVPAERGFVYFENGLLISDDVADRPMVIKAIGWSFASAEGVIGDMHENYGVVLSIWTDARDPRDHMYEDFLRLYPELERIGLQAGPLQFLGIQPHKWEDPISAATKIAGANLFRFMYSLWRFMQETFIDARAILPDRPAQKRAIRAGRPTAEVRVIRLRKRDPHRHDGDHLEDDDILWSHRWLVKGHWRNQWYPSEQRHAPKWISGYVKGPEHLPLIVKDTVFQVDR